MSRLPRTPHSRAFHGAALACALLLGAGAGAAAGPAFADDNTQDIEVGDCFNTGDELSDYQGASADAPQTVEVVHCDSAHQAEAYAVFTLPDGPYPGEEKTIGIADDKCTGAALSDYLGANNNLPDTMEAYFYYPHAESWAQGDREITCFVGDTAGPSTGSVRHAPS